MELLKNVQYKLYKKKGKDRKGLKAFISISRGSFYRILNLVCLFRNLFVRENSVLNHWTWTQFGNALWDHR